MRSPKAARRMLVFGSVALAGLAAWHTAVPVPALVPSQPSALAAGIHPHVATDSGQPADLRQLLLLVGLMQQARG